MSRQIVGRGGRGEGHPGQTRTASKDIASEAGLMSNTGSLKLECTALGGEP